MNTPKYKKIYDHIVKLILTDEWPVGSNMKSENELINFNVLDNNFISVNKSNAQERQPNCPGFGSPKRIGKKDSVQGVL